jgi:hypothetical protein
MKIKSTMELESLLLPSKINKENEMPSSYDSVILLQKSNEGLDAKCNQSEI